MERGNLSLLNILGLLMKEYEGEYSFWNRSISPMKEREAIWVAAKVSSDSFSSLSFDR